MNQANSTYLGNIKDYFITNVKKNYYTSHSYDIQNTENLFKVVGIITDFLKNSENIDLIKKSLVGDKIIWRDNLLKQQDILSEYLKNNPNDTQTKIMISSVILETSERLLTLAKNDFETSKNISNNKYYNVFNKIINNIDFLGKKKFWNETLERQSNSISTIIDTKASCETELTALKIVIKYCNFFMDGLEKEQNSSVFNNNYKEFAKEEINKVKIDSLKKLKEVRMNDNFNKFYEYPSSSNLQRVSLKDRHNSIHNVL